MSTIALALLCGNAVVALQPPQLVQLGISIPLPESVRDAFMLPAMFATYSPKNEDYRISGRRTQTGRTWDRGRWIELPLSDHFPRRHDITTMQIYVPHHSGIGGPMAAQRAWAVLARKIRANHNRLYPERPVSQVRFGSFRWPKNARGFRAGKLAGKTQVQLWFSEAP